MHTSKIMRAKVQYTKENYHAMIPGTVVMDMSLGSFWNVAKNDGRTVTLKNVAGGANGVRMNINSDYTSTVFVMLDANAA